VSLYVPDHSDLNNSPGGDISLLSTSPISPIKTPPQLRTPSRTPSHIRTPSRTPSRVGTVDVPLAIFNKVRSLSTIKFAYGTCYQDGCVPILHMGYGNLRGDRVCFTWSHQVVPNLEVPSCVEKYDPVLRQWSSPQKFGRPLHLDPNNIKTQIFRFPEVQKCPTLEKYSMCQCIHCNYLIMGFSTRL
jgi:hypothetical protein